MLAVPLVLLALMLVPAKQDSRYGSSDDYDDDLCDLDAGGSCCGWGPFVWFFTNDVWCVCRVPGCAVCAMTLSSCLPDVMVVWRASPARYDLSQISTARHCYHHILFLAQQAG